MAEDEPVLETIVSGKYAMIDLWHEPSATDKREAGTILKRIECASLADRPWSQLSQGERQRALIGRALMARPKLLMLDEPCAGLDPVAREHFLQFIDRLGRQRNTPAIVHHSSCGGDRAGIYPRPLAAQRPRCGARIGETNFEK